MNFVVFIVLLVLNFIFYECRQYRYDYKFVAELDGWIKLHQVPATWEEARLRCQLEGAILSSPASINVVAAMKNAMKNTRNIWDFYRSSCNVFKRRLLFSRGKEFVTGVPLEKMPVEWMPFEPDNEGNDESCIVMLANGTIADVNCYEVFPYICYRKRQKDVVVTECGAVDKEYVLDKRTGNCYKFHTVHRNWTRAFMTCSAEGAHLAIVNSETEAAVMRDLFNKHPANTLRFDTVLIGFHDFGERGVWTTIHGQSLQEAGYAKFNEGQPDATPPGEYCGGMFRPATLNDVWCHENLAFICEKTVDSLLGWNDY